MRDIPEPHAGPGELVLDVELAGITGTDLKAFRRGHPKIIMPGPFGHEVIGVIRETGEGVTNWKVGERVASLHTAPCWNCPACARGQTNLCANFESHINLGAFAEQLRIPAPIVSNYVFRLPDHVHSGRAIFLQSLSCVKHGLNLLKGQPDESVLIQGVGCLGLLLGFSLRGSGRDVMLASRRSERRKIAEGYGFQTLPVDESGSAVLPERFGQRGGLLAPDIVIEAAGTESSWRSAIETVRPGGKVLLFGGLAASSHFLLDHQRTHYKEIQIVNSFHYTPPAVHAAARALGFGAKSEEVSEKIGDDFAPENWLSYTTLDKLEEAFASLDRGEALKYAVVRENSSR